MYLNPGGDQMKKIILSAGVLGVAITLITGMINTTPKNLVGATHYGFPWAWRYVPVVPNPVATYDLTHFLGDIVAWCVVVSIPLLLWWKMKKK